MADAVRIAVPVQTAVPGSAARGQHHHAWTSFHQVLARAWSGTAHRGVVHQAVMRPPTAGPTAQQQPALPAAADAALTQAMTLENVPQSWQSGLRFIMAHESGGHVDARNPEHSARGLY